MANRFYDNYRPQHSGQDVFGGMISNPKHSDTQQPYSSDWQENVWTMSRPTSTSKKGGPTYNPSPVKGKPWDGQGPYGDEGPAGGATVPRKPKPSPKNPSGGMKLPLPTKVGQ